MKQKLIQKHYSLIFLFVYENILLGYFFSSLTSSIISNVMSRYWPLCQPLLHLFEESLVKLVDRIVAGGDQVLNRVWEGLVFPRNTLEGLQTDTCGHVGNKITENMHTFQKNLFALSKNEKSSQGLSPSTPATVSSLCGSLNQTCSKRLRYYGVYVWRVLTALSEREGNMQVPLHLQKINLQSILIWLIIEVISFKQKWQKLSGLLLLFCLMWYWIVSFWNFPTIFWYLYTKWSMN